MSPILVQTFIDNGLEVVMILNAFVDWDCVLQRMFAYCSLTKT